MFGVLIHRGLNNARRFEQRLSVKIVQASGARILGIGLVVTLRIGVLGIGVRERRFCCGSLRQGVGLLLLWKANVFNF